MRQRQAWRCGGLVAAAGRVHSRGMASQRLSFRRGPSEPPLYRGTIPEHFAATVTTHGHRPAVVTRAATGAPTTVLSYHELDLLSNRLATALADLGIVKGDRVAVSLGNGPEFAGLSYAVFKLGAVLVPLNPSFGARQVVAALRHLDARLLVVAAVADLPYRPARGRPNDDLLAQLLLGADAAAAGADLPAVASAGVRSEDVPSLRHVVVVDNCAHHGPDELVHGCARRLRECRALTPYRDLLLGSDRPVVPVAPLEPSDTINIQFTSGTTSMPKAAMLSHTSILNNGLFIARRMGLAPADRIVVPPPLFHCFGSVLGYMATATTGAAILFPSPAFDPVATLRMCVDDDATGLYGVTTMLCAVLDALDARVAAGASGPDPDRLRKGIVAGSCVPDTLVEAIHRRLGLADLVICYGMTETSPVSCMTAPGDPADMRTSSVGRPMPHTTVKIVSPTDRSHILPLDTPGELAAAGYLVMKGYYDDPKRTAEVRVDEWGTIWMYSGDEARMDADGYVTITGRIKDLIIRGGENIHPLEVEKCLLRLPGVHDVAVVGVPDDRLGETVAAFIILNHGWSADDGPSSGYGSADGDGSGSVLDKTRLAKDDVRAWVRARLSSHLAPKHVFWIDKIQKFKLRETAIEALKAK